jgi:hypothetical protein
MFLKENWDYLKGINMTGSFYSTVRIIDGKLEHVILDEYGVIIKNPTIEQIKNSIIGNPPKRCYKCGADGRFDLYKDYDAEKRWAGRYICKSCWRTIHKDMLKSIRNCRTKELSISSEKGKGLLGEAVVARVRKLDVLCTKFDNFNYIYDLSIDPEYGVIQVKARRDTYGAWYVSHFNNLDFDNFLLLCMDRLWVNVIKVYVIPLEEIIHRNQSVSIYDNPSRTVWYEHFEIDEKPYNKSYHSLVTYLGNRKYFGFRDIENWLIVPDVFKRKLGLNKEE